MRTYNEDQLKKIFRNKKLLIASHEAGASEILSSLIKRQSPEEALFILDGPARNIFQARFPGIKIHALSKDILKAIDIVITGASLIANLERETIAMAKQSRKYCISILDSWVNYKERFVPVGWNGSSKMLDNFLPDEIWVTDKYAYYTALGAGLPENRLALIDNYYLKELKKNAFKYSAGENAKCMLYICEPVYDYAKLLKGDGNAWGYNEYDLIGDVVKSLAALENNFEKIIFRLHPTEEPDKYKELFSSYSGNVKIEITSPKEAPLEKDCMRASCVVGGESMALVAALFLGKKVFSCLPEKATKPCVLPHKEIVHINSIKEVLNFTGGAN